MESEKNTSGIVSSEWAVGGCQHIGSRKEQQDSYGHVSGVYRDRPTLLAVLADGMGGMNDGAAFSRLAVQTHTDFFQVALDKYRIPYNVLLGLAIASNQSAAKIYDPDKPGGTTLISAMFLREYLYFLSVGDSRICLVRDRKMMQLNREHLFGTILDERAWMGFIPQEDVVDNLLRDRLSSSIGEPKLRRVDLIEHPIALLPGDRILLMSDGVYRALSDDEIVRDFLPSPQGTADKIIDHVQSKHLSGQDNNSILIVEKL